MSIAQEEYLKKLAKAVIKTLAIKNLTAEELLRHDPLSAKSIKKSLPIALVTRIACTSVHFKTIEEVAEATGYFPAHLAGLMKRIPATADMDQNIAEIDRLMKGEPKKRVKKSNGISALVQEPAKTTLISVASIKGAMVDAWNEVTPSSPIKVKSIEGSISSNRVVIARQTAIFAIRILKPELSIADIGKAFGGRSEEKILDFVQQVAERVRHGHDKTVDLLEHFSRKLDLPEEKKAALLKRSPFKID